MKGTATQSSTLAGGATGGHARARDRRRPRARPAGRHRSAQGHGRRSRAPEQDPWWELDLGAERPIDTIALWAAAPATRGTASTSASSTPAASRCSSRTACGSQAPMHTVDVGGDLDDRRCDGRDDRAAARHARAGGRDRAAARDAGDQARRLRQAALAAHPPHAAGSAWPAAQIAPVAREVLRDLRGDSRRRSASGRPSPRRSPSGASSSRACPRGPIGRR